MADANIPGALNLEVVTPGREVVRDTVSEIQLPGRAGYLGILPGHTPLLTELGIGALSYKKSAQTFYVAILGGFAEVLPDRVIVLAEAAERSDEINAESARAALAEAEKKLASSTSDPAIDSQGILQSIASERVRLEVASHGTSGSSPTRQEPH